MNNVRVKTMSKSVIHILNVRLQNLPPIIFSRETNQYDIFYEQKIYAIHKLLVKVQKGIDILNENIDLNINIYNRASIKFNANPIQLMLRPDETIDKTISMRITKTKYPDLPLKYVNFVQIFEKKTWVGAETKLVHTINECGMIVRDAETCYKTISIQKANTHWVRTIAIVKPSPQPVKIGKIMAITSRMNYYEKDLYA